MKFTFNAKEFVKSHFLQIKQIRDAPHAVAGGVAIGMFWGFTPLTGLKSVLSILFAWVFRCSKLSAVLTVAFHDIFLPIWPIILRWEYDLGYWILSHPHRFPPRLTMGKIHWGDWFHWKTLQFLWPTCLGSILIALPLALLSYWAVERSLERYERTHDKHLTPPA